MGKNLPSKTHSVGQPTQRYLRYMLNHDANPNAGNNDSHFIDIAQGLSAINSRFYRQGLYYHVSGVTVHDSNQNAWVKFATAPDTWITKNAWVRGFRAWSKMNSLAASAAGQDDLAIAGKYHDYKIWLSENHRTNADSGLLPIASGDYATISGIFPNYVVTPAIVEFLCDEWTTSKYITADPPTDQFEAHLIGPHVGADGGRVSIGLVESYIASRQTVPEFSPVQSTGTNADPLMNLFDSADVQDDILQDLEDDSDQVPYDYNHRPGQGVGHTVIVAQTANSAGAGAVTRTPGFVVPFGLLEVITNSATDGNIEIVLEISPGSYHGVAAARVA